MIKRFCSKIKASKKKTGLINSKELKKLCLFGNVNYEQNNH